MEAVNEDLNNLMRPDPVMLGGYNSDSSDCSIEEFYVIDYNYEGKGKGQRRFLRPISPLPTAMKVPDFLPAIGISNRITDAALPRSTCSSYRAPLVNAASRGSSRVAATPMRQREPVSKYSETRFKLRSSERSNSKSLRSKTEYYLKETPEFVNVLTQEKSCPSISAENANHARPRTKKKIKRPETFTITRSGKGDG